MTERRETGRTDKKSSGTRNPKTTTTTSDADWDEGERIAKYLARAGVASRRAVERLIEEGEVTVNGKKLTTPAFKVTGRETIKVGRKTIKAPEPTRLWLYHKPAGLISTNFDPEGRRTIFEELPRSLPRVVTVGRLDLNTEGLLLLTNDGELARKLELPSTGLERTYRVRAKGTVTEFKIADLAAGITVEGVKYQPITAVFDRETGANSWLTVTLSEGKKREVRRALESVNLLVNRLIRVKYGPFELGEIKPGAVAEVEPHVLAEAFGEHFTQITAPDPKTASPKSRLGRRRQSTKLRTNKKRTRQ